MSGCINAEPARTGRAHIALNRLQGSSRALAGLLEQLRERLTPALNVPPPTEKAVGDCGRPGESAPLVESLMAEADDLDGMASIVRDLLDRVEV